MHNLGMDKVVTTQDTTNERFLALEETEKRVFQAFRKGLEAIRALAKELSRIESDELFTLRNCDKFSDYVETYLRMDMRTVRRVYGVAATLTVLERAGLRLPENEAQAAELARLEPEVRGAVWERILAASDELRQPVTMLIVRTAVDKEEERRTKAQETAAQAAPPKRKGIQVDLDDGDDVPVSSPAAVPPPPKRKSLSEKGEAALTRLRSLCGEPLAEAIETETLPISERDIITWGNLEDSHLVKNLAHYIANLRWSLAKAIAYESKQVDGATTCDELVTLARARGGRASVRHEEMRIIIEKLES